MKGTATAYRQPVATVSCPSGKRMTGGGGGCKSLTDMGWTLLVSSYPSSENEWRVQCNTPVNQNVLAEAYAVCH